MTRKMLVVIAAVFTPFLMGQMCGTTGPVETDRLEVTQRLRESCAAFKLTDDEIEQAILINEEIRLQGYTLEQALAADRAGCSTAACTNCSEAITRQVYGQ